MPSRDENLREQRRALPDSPGVYLFKDANGRALYVGKAKSIRKRVGVALHDRATRIADEFLSKVESIDFVATANEAEALLAEQNFIKQYRPALQHPPSRRQVVSVHRDLARRAFPAGLLHARAAP